MNFGKQNFSLLIKRGAQFLIVWREENFVSKLFKYIPNIKLLIDLNNGDYFIGFSFLIKEVHGFCEERKFEIFH